MWSPGIGSSYRTASFGVIDLAGGEIFATGASSAPAIGGGYEGYSGEIVIGENADVTVFSPESNSVLGVGWKEGWDNPITIAGKLRIPSGNSLEILQNQQLAVSGTILNAGIISLEGDIAFSDFGSVQNDSIIYVAEGTQLESSRVE